MARKKSNIRKAIDKINSLPILAKITTINSIYASVLLYCTAVWYTKIFNSYIPLVLLTYMQISEDLLGMFTANIIKHLSLFIISLSSVIIAIMDVVLVLMYIGGSPGMHTFALYTLWGLSLPISFIKSTRKRMIYYYIQNCKINISKLDVALMPIKSIGALTGSILAFILASLFGFDNFAWVVLVITIMMVFPEIIMLRVILKTKINILGKDLVD